MRILHVVPSYYPAIRYGGPIRSVHGLAAAQVQNGHSVDVFTTNIDGESNLDVPLQSPVDMDGVRVRYFPVSRLRRLCVAPSMAPALRAQLADTDVVHLHSVYLWPTYVAARAARHAGVPYLLAPRGMLVGSLIDQKSRMAKRLWIEAVEKRTLRHSAGIHVTTDVERDELCRIGLALSRIHCVPNGVSIPGRIKAFSGGDADLGEHPFALYLGRLNWKKGIDRLLHAWKSVSGPCRLVIAGNDENGYRSMLESLVEALQLRDRVTFLGEVNDDEKWDLYRRAKLFVLPSISENFGNVVLEAMGMGCPVVVSDGVGLAQLVKGLDCGVVCRNEPAELAAAISSLLRNPDSPDIGERGRKAVIERFSWKAVSREMQSVYDMVVHA